MTMHKVVTKAPDIDLIAVLARATPAQLERLAADILRSTKKPERDQ